MRPYQDGKHLSYGFGHNGPDVSLDDVMPSIDDAFALLIQDLNGRAITVSRYIKTEVTQNQFDALLSLYQNAGSGPLARMAELVNKRCITKAGEQFPRYCRVRDDDPTTEVVEFRESEGLRRRRLSEQTIYFHGDYGDCSWFPYWTGDPFKTPMTRYPMPVHWLEDGTI
ncbi:MAG: hypothetical protein H0U63_01160 [Burkholderiales bacterium]|nr:hypothetical protein [Burkholderiales bacterium]